MSNIGARTWELLRQQSKRAGNDVQSLATSYAIERFMARLMQADISGNITVKGGQSLGILFGNQMRPTKDLDINIGREGIDDPEVWARSSIMAACDIEAEDGVSIDVSGVNMERREHQGEGGLRITVPASIHTCRVPFLIDVGIGNEITFEPSKIEIAGILEGHKAAPPPLHARVYPHENTLAEKLMAKIEDGIASIRHKDFFDIWLMIEIMRRVGDLKLLVLKPSELSAATLATVNEVKARLVDGSLLAMPETDIDEECVDRLGLALSRTAEHRGTTIPDDMHAWLVQEFGVDEQQSTQWANWCRNQKSRLLFQPPGTGKDTDRLESLNVLFDDIGPFLELVAQKARVHSPQQQFSPGL